MHPVFTDMSSEAVLILSDPYQAYVEGSVFSGNPLSMVIALYEGTIDAVRKARECLVTGDAWGRSKAITKAIKLLTQLLISLDHKQGGEISANLKRLYSYLQCQLLEAHAKKAEEPLHEAERLLNTMLEGWRGALEKMDRLPEHGATPTADYRLFNEETAEPAGCVSALF
jgi:flagellar secretion chaperone FliS